MNWRIGLTLALLCGMWAFGALYSEVQGPLEGAAAVAQLNNSSADYVTGRAVSQGLVPKLVYAIGLFSVLALWVSFFLSKKTADKPKSEGGFVKINLMLMVMLASLAAMLFTGCTSCMGPAKVEQFVDVAPNETAFLVPLEGNTKDEQGKFMSEAYLNENKVPAKRISLPLREKSTGRMWYEYEWLRTAQVILVNRAPLTREWTSNEATGTSAANQSLCVQSVDTVGFCFGANVTATILEKDAATFLYWFSGKTLAEVMDTNIRGDMVGGLSDIIGKQKLELALDQRIDTFAKVSTAVKEKFQKQGITLSSIGLSEGVQFINKDIQTAVESKYVAEMNKQRATTEAATLLIKTDGEAAARNSAATSIAASNAKINASLTSLLIQRQSTEKWDGKLPQIMGAGTIPMVNLNN